VLIVEDEPTMRTTLRQFIQAELPGQRVLEAADGAQAIELCILYHPRVVLMDVNLPDTNGITLTEGIKRRFPDITVIIVSSHVGSTYREHAKAAGAAGYVAKEHIHRDLIPQIRRALRGDGRAEGERAS